MAEPASSTVVGIAIAAGTITLTGSVLGVQYDALLAGLFGGLVSLSYLPAMTWGRIAGSVAGSALIAGWFAPLASITASNYFPFMSAAGESTIRIAAAAALGLGAQVVIPAAFAWMRKKGGAP
ncbi:restriction endonuclease [Janthinobacterium sp.]|uniref:restriction endonuclease n=1 Tax=Janthinobacterium sp. TaxID=1871054 RepID=UPI00293D3EA7|nr:restriction endonuclease [Janthinobacterium sp.]